ncbi:MAG: phenylalanine--tRNA ligase subunit beta [Wenzhouxiangellaceae bacterium]
MKCSVQWLADLSGLELDGQELARKLTAAGLEVDEVTPAGGELPGVVVAEIVAAEPHPDADRLQVCTVSLGQAETVQIVCGAPNARVGLKAPLATIGAVLPGDFKIKRAKLRGVESSGMLCSAKELGLSDDAAGLMELPADSEPGMSLNQALALDDQILELELTPNRSDCLGYYGLAREVSALHERRWQSPDVEAVKAVIDDQRGIQLSAAEGCPRYLGRVVRDVDTSAPTPLWMRERLRRSGVRSISVVVDVTNYVLLEMGQPMHAFDLERLDGDIDVRWARDGETLRLLDGSEATLNPRHLLICDQAGPVALAGIMGGDDSAVGDETRHIFLESAWFSPAAIMGRARDLGMATDAAHRFERGIDPSGQERAIERATALIVSICGGRPGPLCVGEAAGHLPEAPTIPLRADRLATLLGVTLDADRVSAILHDLGMQVTRNDDGWAVTPPPARLDLAIEADLVEEVARVYGYDAIPARLPGGNLQPQIIPEAELDLRRVRDRLCDSGYHEAVTYSFIDRDWLEPFGWAGRAIALANPISQDMNVMRPSLIPGLLRALQHNVQRQQAQVRLFELGTTFAGDGSEAQSVAAVCYGLVRPQQWGGKSRAVDFYDCKGDLESLLSLSPSAAPLRFEPADENWLHPGQSATVYRGEQRLGWVGALHPSLLRALNLEGQIYAFEMDLQQLRQRELPKYRGYSRFPRIRRDLSLQVPEAVTGAQLMQAINAQAGEVLKESVIFDVYHGPGVEKAYKSIAMGLILQNDCSTLTDSDADDFVADLLQGLHDRLGITLRG